MTESQVSKFQMGFELDFDIRGARPYPFGAAMLKQVRELLHHKPGLSDQRLEGPFACSPWLGTEWRLFTRRQPQGPLREYPEAMDRRASVDSLSNLPLPHECSRLLRRGFGLEKHTQAKQDRLPQTPRVRLVPNKLDTSLSASYQTSCLCCSPLKY
jgi:hypothetical protein